MAIMVIVAPLKSEDRPAWEELARGYKAFYRTPTMWYGDACYLQDLFVAEAARGRGAARALIERVAEMARIRGVTRLYWNTQEDNARARLLYDKVARFNGFIRYDYPL
jgi:GNAT superfamily N-acetyltransferase